MKKLLTALSASALLISSVTAVTPAMAEDEPIKIMCIGDSITDGYVNDYVGSYRKFIYHNLTELGYNIDMVGAKDGGWTPTYTDDEKGETWEFDNENTGYSGYAIKEYSGRSGIYETLISTDCIASTKPDIITLQIGTNDIIDNHEIDTAGERLEILVDYILDSMPENAVLFLSTIPSLDPNRSEVYDWFGNYRHSADWSEQYDDKTAEENVLANIESYNLQVRFLAEKKQEEGKKVILSDAPEMIDDVKTQLFDGVHPNNYGYSLMGDEWTMLINDYLSSNTSSETTTTATTATTQTTTTALIWNPETTTTTTNPDDEKTLKVADLLRLTRYVLGYSPDFYSYTADDIKSYDFNNDGRTDVFDVIIMREKLTDSAKKLTEKQGEGFMLIEDDNIVIYPDEYYETMTTTTTVKYEVVVDIDEDYDIPPSVIDWVLS